ncbi:hypothetical protein N7495_006319 [Penicillium taxi]|uniref:uncharacterized protein n=1 Tax=Penicillium taxi TaxID=168475 RepID=UPI0025456C52|nr:uncharacterized protein N7495_006319 [Penicillium taxi]KAJ5894628.1 hypothetical protein N7495_006319 [Penicillium taxi]
MISLLQIFTAIVQSTGHVGSSSEFEYVCGSERDSFQLILQPDAGYDLKFLAMPKGVDPTNEYYENADYAFLSGAGSKVTVYVHDSGINLDHSEFTSPPPKGVKKGTIEWLYPEFDTQSVPEGNWDPRPVFDPIGHGTCVADKVVGHKWGVAKGASLKMVPTIDIDSDFWMKAGLRTIIKDIEKEREKDPNFIAIVNFSYVLRDTISAQLKQDFYRLYREIYEIAIVVATAGNWKVGSGSSEVTQYPAVLVKYFPNMIVVGSIDVYGFVSSFSRSGDLISVYAPGELSIDEGLDCAQGSTRSSTDEEKKYGMTQREGTSFSTPIVSGVVAYLISVNPSWRRVNTVAEVVKAKIMKMAWSRDDVVSIESPGVWNGQDGLRCY